MRTMVAVCLWSSVLSKASYLRKKTFCSWWKKSPNTTCTSSLSTCTVVSLWLYFSVTMVHRHKGFLSVLRNMVEQEGTLCKHTFLITTVFDLRCLNNNVTITKIILHVCRKIFLNFACCSINMLCSISISIENQYYKLIFQLPSCGLVSL